MEQDKTILKGIGVSAGVVKGKVRIIKGAKDASSFNEGDILVTEITDPTMVIMMSKAGAMVTDIGGMTSHPAIVSRELGIPCVVNTKEATKILKDGDLIEVDGEKGIIKKLG